VRITTVFKRLLALKGVTVADVEFGEVVVRVEVALRRRRLMCPHCRFTTRARYDMRPVASTWRHPDLGTWRVEIEAPLWRLRCPTHGIVTEGVPFARPGANLTRDLDDLIAWLTTRMDKTAVTRLCRVSWRTVGRVCERVVATELDPARLEDLRRIGVDEISWRKHHKYLTLITDHDRRRVVWGAPGKDTETLDRFFAELGPECSAEIEAVTLDLGAAFLKSVRADGHAPQAVVCADPFHLVKLAGEALDAARRDHWQQLRRLDPGQAKWFKGSRWALLKNPGTLTEAQAAQLHEFQRRGGAVWRAYEMKEQFREIFAGDLNRDEAGQLLRRWCSRASRSRLAPFVRCAATMREHREVILNAVEQGLSNGRVEGFTTKVRMIIRRAYGFHSAEAALALVMLSCGPIELTLPHERSAA
jgi:transposase